MFLFAHNLLIIYIFARPKRKKCALWQQNGIFHNNLENGNLQKRPFPPLHGSELEELALANAKFATEMDKKAAELTDRMSEKDVSTEEARAECDRLYNQIIAMVNAYALIQPTEAITTYVAQQTGIVETFRSIASNTGKNHDEEEETTTNVGWKTVIS